MKWIVVSFCFVLDFLKLKLKVNRSVDRSKIKIDIHKIQHEDKLKRDRERYKDRRYVYIDQSNEKRQDKTCFIWLDLSWLELTFNIDFKIQCLIFQCLSYTFVQFIIIPQQRRRWWWLRSCSCTCTCICSSSSTCTFT